ncbi:Proteolipid membrane potential modulator family-containing protein [Strongyloides ratti]|uniref:Proteolipid membrane potential modulator family-containing protein n=1 Tax=Strongyloides ratti TaxID=34506 RepID=A0A090L5J8_STRRB|nr:Proteolipid membrane potential modulator family-containing protein [Strongyloides ratti]CEF65002.1 Proteolipid membrane potential modulator family-containing protein [Strongyloides ratti]
MVDDTCYKVCLILLALFLPPVAVLIKDGIGLQFILNILLFIFGALPGIVHAIWVCFVRVPEENQLQGP